MILIVNESVLMVTGLMMIAFLSEDSTQTMVGMALVVVFSINLAALFVINCVYEIRNAWRYCWRKYRSGMYGIRESKCMQDVKVQPKRKLTDFVANKLGTQHLLML